ncbi:MAG: hypothetical protein J6N18_11300, partial [Kiritimatiellae bacterium]|nr:hypothetical protein [Kiritimatiellia bacterium]
MNRRDFMTGMVAGAATSLFPCGCASSPQKEGIKLTRFRPFAIPGLERRPDFWKVRVDEIMDICSKAKKCARKEIICRTPLGYPVYALFYGEGFDDAPPQ